MIHMVSRQKLWSPNSAPKLFLKVNFCCMDKFITVSQVLKFDTHLRGRLKLKIQISHTTIVPEH